VGCDHSAAEAAVVNLVRQAALDLAQDKILVNGIAPAPIDGGMLAGVRAPAP
jgi:NAD(P)-dependent dehydrogenase (short-subunit alcohol dehydrogenase family)